MGTFMLKTGKSRVNYPALLLGLSPTAYLPHPVLKEALGGATKEISLSKKCHAFSCAILNFGKARSHLICCNSGHIWAWWLIIFSTAETEAGESL